jgi:predicted nucleic acid-binding protein
VIHLDTSFLIRALVRGAPEDVRLRGWLRERESVAVSALAWSEFLCGPLTPEAVELAALLLGEPLPFTADDAVVAAQLFNKSGRRRGSLLDCMIAAAALAANAQLATSNTADFQRLSKLGLSLA